MTKFNLTEESKKYNSKDIMNIKEMLNMLKLFKMFCPTFH